MVGSPGVSEDNAVAIRDRGFAIVRSALDDEAVSHLLAELARAERCPSIGRRKQVYAIRNLMEIVPAVRELADSEALRRLAKPVLGANAFPVQGIFFDKPTDVNWKVPWHQDLSIAVEARREVEGFGPWSVKAGVPHVQPPVALLERMLIIRLHLDESTEQNGPLRVIPGSHVHGRLVHSQIRGLRDQVVETLCLVPRGGALLMRPLLLHASSGSQIPSHRRVIHLVYAGERLPAGLDWYTSGPGMGDPS
jgi:hypothetical protein